MDDNTATLPVEHIHQFWTEVEKRLRDHHGLSTPDALRGIIRFRDTIDRVGPLVYHAEPAEVADGIVNGGHVPRDSAAG